MMGNWQTNDAEREEFASATASYHDDTSTVMEEEADTEKSDFVTAPSTELSSSSSSSLISEPADIGTATATTTTKQKKKEKSKKKPSSSS